MTELFESRRCATHTVTPPTAETFATRCAVSTDNVTLGQMESLTEPNAAPSPFSPDLSMEWLCYCASDHHPDSVAITIPLRSKKRGPSQPGPLASECTLATRHS
jgi:hypothetical protein